MADTDTPTHRIRTGIGGWTFAPWRGNFYPAGLPHGRELHYASRQLPAIEINGTFYGSQKPATYARWRDETPGGFLFSLKASRYCTHRRVLAEAGESIDRFVSSGIAELGPKLGPILWQFAPAKAFDATDFGAFLQLLPDHVGGLALRHVLEVRHPSFMDPAFLALARRHRCATVFTDAEKFPSFADATADFVYARLLMAEANEPTGYTPAALDRWAAAARTWSEGGRPDGLHYVEPERSEASTAARDVFVYFINGAKERAPAAAGALLQRLGLAPLA
jgi:uncharacterized protein YecE (DUF72 family)